jgi:hypothetical protein
VVTGAVKNWQGFDGEKWIDRKGKGSKNFSRLGASNVAAQMLKGDGRGLASPVVPRPPAGRLSGGKALLPPLTFASGSELGTLPQTPEHVFWLRVMNWLWTWHGRLAASQVTVLIGLDTVRGARCYLSASHIRTVEERPAE